MYIAIKLLIATLTSTSTTQVDDLCDVVHRLTGTPTICKAHKQGAPIFDANVCCAGETCFPESTSGCQGRESLYYCELGEVRSTGEVDCYFEVPNFCDIHPCESMIAPPPYEDSVCCEKDKPCVPFEEGSGKCNFFDIYYCVEGVCNPDGTVTCFKFL